MTQPERRQSERRQQEAGPPVSGERRGGRRRMYDEAASVCIVVRVTHAQRRDLQTVARDNQMNVAAVIREAVDEFVTDYRESGGVFRIPKPAA